jgi:hypothetical protein
MDLEQFKTQRDALMTARFQGVLTVKAGDKQVTYRSDAEMRTALNDLERRIATLEGRSMSRRILTYTDKGL